MCLHPVRVKNPKRDFDSNCDRLYNVVSCNHCPECNIIRKNDYLLRSCVEFENAAMGYFFTLTYDNLHIPTYFVNGQCYTGFSHRDIQLFLKRLRERVRSRWDADIRYIITSEYGSRTHRPHYHGLIFLNKVVPINLLIHQVRVSWSLGFIRSGSRNHGIIDSYQACQYVCKYVCKFDKDSYHLLELFKQFNIRDLNSKILNHYLSTGEVDCEALMEHRLAEHIRECLPLVVKSINFGARLFDSPSFMISDGIVTFYDSYNQVMKSIPLPSYYYRCKYFIRTYRPELIKEDPELPFQSIVEREMHVDSNNYNIRIQHLNNSDGTIGYKLNIKPNDILPNRSKKADLYTFLFHRLDHQLHTLYENCRNTCLLLDNLYRDDALCANLGFDLSCIGLEHYSLAQKYLNDKVFAEKFCFWKLFNYGYVSRDNIPENINLDLLQQEYISRISLSSEPRFHVISNRVRDKIQELERYDARVNSDFYYLDQVIYSIRSQNGELLNEIHSEEYYKQKHVDDYMREFQS